MTRRHGWQLPAHSFQVLATTIFFILSIAFYAFFAPFLGKKLYEYVAVAVYSLFAFFVIILYIRCAAIDPADSEILIDVDGVSTYKSQSVLGPREPNQIGLNPELKTRDNKVTNCWGISCYFCNLMVKEDCRNNVDITQQQSNNDEGLYCTLCNAEVGKLSKHCSSCDKCVDGFDHHCRWLNNCIGRKNYVTFLLLMATSLAWIAFECGVGISVLVRCFVNKREIQNEVINRLGDVFSRIPLIMIVAICTALALIALFPLGELFFFHMILIKKGITTYDFVVAMRTQNEPPVNEERSLPSSSPMSSVPTVISGSSLGLHHKVAWCTPPRITVNDPEEITPHLERNCISSNIDPDDPGPAEFAKRASKQQVRISAWKLAKLDSNEAMKAGAKARASSSVLRPISSRTSSPISHGGTPTSLPFVGSYPATPSTLSSPPVTDAQHHLSIKHFNPIFQSSVNQSPWSARTSDREDSAVMASSEHGALRSGDANIASKTNTSSSVYWDQEAGRFVSSQNVAGSSSSRTGKHAEFVYSGHSIFFGGPLSNERMQNSRNGDNLLNQQQRRQQQSGVGRGRGSSQQPGENK